MRRKGSRNKGYWFRTGRGWYVTEESSSIPLCDVNGNHIKSADAAEEAKEAYARHLLGRKPKVSTLTVREGCEIYLDHAESNGAAQTFNLRAGYLYDLCNGLPAKFRESGTKPTSKDRIHSGYGDKPLMELTKLDVERWIRAHPGWKAPRTALQAVRRMANYCDENGLIESSPLRGLKVPKAGKRVAYISSEVEEAIYQHARPALALAVKVCILTGARPDIEFASLEPRHVEEMPQGQRWVFPANESKGRQRGRTIYVPTEVAEIVRKRIKRQRSGKVFRNESGEAWSLRGLQSAYRRLKKHLLRKGVEVDEPFVPYVCRHTYAKRMLGGYWGKPVTLEVLAGLMGNTPKICWEHYAQWSEQYVEPFWQAISRGETSPEELAG